MIIYIELQKLVHLRVLHGMSLSLNMVLSMTLSDSHAELVTIILGCIFFLLT
jgi:hypothetical protein